MMFPDSKDQPTTLPVLLLNPEQILAIYNNENNLRKNRMVTDMQIWIQTTALERGWTYSRIIGRQVLLSITDLTVIKKEEVSTEKYFCGSGIDGNYIKIGQNIVYEIIRTTIPLKDILEMEKSLEFIGTLELNKTYYFPDINTLESDGVRIKLADAYGGFLKCVEIRNCPEGRMQEVLPNIYLGEVEDVKFSCKLLATINEDKTLSNTLILRKVK